MNRLIDFLLIITLNIVSNEACEDSMLIFRNRLGAGRNLNVQCESNKKNRVTGIVKFKENPVRISFREAAVERTTWHCSLQQGTFSLSFLAYRGGFPVPKCGELQVYIAKLDGIYSSKNADPEKLVHRWVKNPK